MHCTEGSDHNNAPGRDFMIESFILALEIQASVRVISSKVVLLLF